ncbi:MAG: CYTH domain-containing protein [Caldiserica bacterium]|nr:CYTH domain-containing protein [Caldisericota bacterium]
MGTEREVKYQVLDQALFRRLNAMDHIGNFALEHAGTVDILTIYLDTPELTLFYSHHALRLRIMQGRVFLSLKGPSTSSDGLVQERPEDEADAPGFSEKLLPGAEDAMRLLPSSVQLLKSLTLCASLRSLDKRALHYVLHQSERAYEIACDSVVFSSPRRPGIKADATELEIEQKAGSVEGLQDLMRAFETFFAVVPRRGSSKYQDGLKALELI